MPEVPSEVPVGSGENISESVCISRGKIVRVTTDYFDTNPNVLTVAIEELANVKFFGYVLMWPSETVRLSFLVLKDSQICF